MTALKNRDYVLSFLEKTLAADPRRKEVHENLAELCTKLCRVRRRSNTTNSTFPFYPAAPKA